MFTEQCRGICIACLTT
ncbi:hypothetical protein QX220_21285 [Vibrio vulnificus]|nr:MULTISPECIES: hypothetical protein [Vibrio]MDK2622558.1 hypothetical protein [Vibrio vulnificus]MDS1864166.1 hypothetical protein [Vibrio vulnificus]